MNRILRPIKTLKGIHHPLLAIDIENNPKTGAFICAGVYGKIKHRTTTRVNGKPKTIYVHRDIDNYYTNEDTFREFILNIEKNTCILVFFNLSYDRWYLDSITDHKSVLAIGTKVITARTYNGLKMIDLCNHVDGSLENWINYLDMTNKWGISKAELTDYYDRVMNDAKATFRLGEFLEDFYYYECGVPLQLTVASNAMRIFTNKFFNDYWKRDNDFISEYERESYYGGRTEIFKRGKQLTFSYDVNSMYLSIMRDCLIPNPASAMYCSKGFDGCIEKYLYKYQGIWDVTVTIDDLYLPLLPVRLDGKLKFPIGTFRGKWTSPELIKALELGYKIDIVHSFIWYRFSHKYFSDFAGFVWDRRKEYKTKGNKGMDLMIKKIGNSLYGKFAQRNSTDYFGRLSDYDGDIEDGEIQFIEYKDEIWVRVKGELIPARFEFPCVSSFITAFARLKLYEAMEKNQDGIIYCDTDSIKITHPARDIFIGDDLGEWGLEIQDQVIEYHKPKLYGEKRKGVPKRGKLIEKTGDFEKWEYDKPMRYRESINRGLIPNIWHTVTKILSLEDDKREWDGENSTPIKIMVDN